MPQYLTWKPIAVNAIPVKDLIPLFEKDWKSLPDWVKGAYEDGIVRAIHDRGFTIKTSEGLLEATFEDMLIQGIKGELYPCKIDIFEQFYEIV